MDHDMQTASGRAVVERSFSIAGRGRVLVLQDGFQGGVPRNGVISTSVGHMPYTGPDFVDSVDERSRLAVLVADDFGAERLPTGESISFYEADASQSDDLAAALDGTDEEAEADVAAGRVVPHQRVREWLTRLAEGDVAPPPEP